MAEGERARPIRGRLRVELIRDLADGDLSHEQLGEKYGRCTQAISNFSANHKDEIMEAKREVAAEIKGRWSVDKGKRVDTLQQELDDLEELIVSGDLSPSMRLRCTDRKIRLLHEIAEQVGELPSRVKIDMTPPPAPVMWNIVREGDQDASDE